MGNLTEELTECIPDSAPSPSQELENQRIGQVVNAFLATLSTEKRVMFVQRYFFAKPVSEIAEALKLSQSNVKVTLHRLREGLRRELEQEDLL